MVVGAGHPGGGLLTGGYVFRVLAGALARAGGDAPVRCDRPRAARSWWRWRWRWSRWRSGLLPLAVLRAGADRAAGRRAVTGSRLLLLAAARRAARLLLACLSAGAAARVPGLLGLAPLPGAGCARCWRRTAPPLVLDPARLRFTLALDAPGALLLGAAALLWSAAGALCRAPICAASRAAQRFAVWWLLTLAGSLGVFVAADLLSFYLPFALVSLAACGLIAHDGTPRAPPRRRGLPAARGAGRGRRCCSAFVLLAAGAPGAEPRHRRCAGRPAGLALARA